jgi:hypothetical protein
MKEDIKAGIITGARSNEERSSLAESYGEEKADLILFLREMERTTRHKTSAPIAPQRQEMIAGGLVE